ncbi:MAG: DUF2231 domain-containing protein [Ilumatobacteraceae bacterium]
MDTLFGLPAHPFLVHIPIVLLPVAAIGVVLMVIKRRWYERYRWVVLAIGAVGTVGAILAADAGEALESRIVAVVGRAKASSWEHHADLGDTAQTFAIVFFIVLAAFVLVPWIMERFGSSSHETGGTSRHRVLYIVLAALAVIGAAGSVTTIIQAGHTGSKSVWEEYVAKTSNGG